jgi:type I restriction enzyme S subunit
MKDDDKQTLTPKLRFPEFRGTCGWEMGPIGDRVDLLSGYPFDGPDISQDSSGTSLLRGINITEGSIRHSSEMDRYYLGSRKGLEKFEVRPNDLVIGMDGSKVGKNSALVSDRDAGSLLIQRVARLRTDDPTLIKFIFLHINGPLFHRYVDKINTSSGIPHISAAQIREFTIGFPTEEAEQWKIAECLGSLDALIAAEGRKLEALRAHKKGLMQHLFPREGETRPRLRFPEFQDAPEWEEELLSSVVGTVKTGKLDANAMVDGGKYRFYTCAENHYRINEYAFDGEALLIAGNGANLGYIHHYIGKFNAYQRTYVLQDFSINVSFLKLFLDRHLPARIENEKKAGNTPYIVLATVTDMPLRVPTGVDEQQRIAACFSSLDSGLVAQSQKLAALRTHKQALMQQLFPSAEGN